MTISSNTQAPGYIRNLLSFSSHTGSLRANYYTQYGVHYYVVYSYAEPIAIHANGVWFVSLKKWSQTTSRHQGLVRQAVQHEDHVIYTYEEIDILFVSKLFEGETP